MERRLVAGVLAVFVFASVAGPSHRAASSRLDRGSPSDPGLPGTRLRGHGVLPNYAARGDDLVRLRVGAFDPLVSSVRGDARVPLVDEATLPAGTAQYWLVQVRGRRYAGADRAVKSSGARVAGVIPQNTYVVRATSQQAAGFRTDPAIRWTGYYQPAWRMATRLFGLPGLMDLKGRRTYRVYVFRSDPHPAAVGRALRNLPGVKVLEDARVVVDVAATSAQLPAIASIPAVEWVGVKPTFVPLNANARWVIDTGVRDLLAAARFDRLTGAGQTAGVADTATNYTTDRLGNAHVAFRDCATTLPSGCKIADYTQRNAGRTIDAVTDIVAHHTSHRKVAAFFDLGATGPNPSDDASHGTHTAGSVVGDAGRIGIADGDDGMAPGARLVDQNIADATGGLAGIPADYYLLFQQAYRPRNPSAVPTSSPAEGNVADYANYLATEDARTHNNSYGAGVPIVDASGQTAAADKFVWDHEDMSIVISASNGGPGAATTTSPSTSKNAFSSGASSNGRQPMVSIGDMANFSSHGPTGDGRFGPTVATPGEIIVGPKGGTNDEYQYLQGTSMSGPVLTGALTLVRQYFYDGYGPSGGKGFGVGAAGQARRWNPSAALVKATVVNGAQRMRGWYTGDDGTRRELDGQWPSAGQGFGLVNLDESLYFKSDPTNNWYHDVWRADDEAFNVGDNGTTRSYSIVADGGAPLDVTLAWTDAPDALSAGTPALVNDLDLIVTGPDGVRIGNNFNSRTNPAVDVAETPATPFAPDSVNNLERIRVADPAPGTYTVQVVATRILTGRQGFALAAGGKIAAPGSSFVAGPPRQADKAGSPVVGGVKATPGGNDMAKVELTTNEPTTATATLSVGGSPVTYLDSFNLGGDVNQPSTFVGMDTAPVETGPDYANRLVVGTHHEIFVTGLARGASYQIAVTATDLAGHKTIRTLSYRSPTNIFQPKAADMAQLGPVGGPDFSWKTGKQMYAGDDDPAVAEGALGAFMFRIPASFDPKKITGAVVELISAHDLTNHYNIDPLFSVDLLDDSVKADWGTQTYAQIHSARAAARALPSTTVRTGGGQPLAFSFACSDLAALKASLSQVTGGERLAPFRWDATHTTEVAIASVEFGFNRRSRGPDLRPRLILLTAGDKTMPPLTVCDPATRAPRISEVRIDNSYTDGDANRFTTDGITVSWRTDVPSDSVVLYRPRGVTTFTEVGTPARTTVHQVRIRGIDTRKHYDFGVRSTACNGASTTADNNGAGWDLYRPPPPSPGPSTALTTLTFDTGAQGWTTQTEDPMGLPPASTWELRAPGDGSPQAWHVEPYGDAKMAHLISPPIAIPGTVGAFRFREHHDLEKPVQGATTTGDALRAEYSTDGGATWKILAEYQEQNESYPNFDTRQTPVFNAPGRTFRIRFTLNSDDNISTPPYQGAAVDTVTPLSYSPPLSPFDPFLTKIGPVQPKTAGLSHLNLAAQNSVGFPNTAAVRGGTGVCVAGIKRQRPPLPATGVGNGGPWALAAVLAAMGLTLWLRRRPA